MTNCNSEDLERLVEPLLDAGRHLMAECNGSIFPCDALAMTVMTRSFKLTHGFKVLIAESNYECAASLLRLALDNVLRLYGVTTCNNPHEIANDVINGIALNTIKHSSGKPMKDAYLVKLVSVRNPWVHDAYKTLSGFIHLSETHFQHMLLQSVRSKDGVRHFLVSDGDDYITEEQKQNLIRMFAVAINGAATLINQWAESRFQHGCTEHLKEKFSRTI